MHLPTRNMLDLGRFGSAQFGFSYGEIPQAYLLQIYKILYNFPSYLCRTTLPHVSKLSFSMINECASNYQPMISLLTFSNCGLGKGFVEISSCWFLASIDNILICCFAPALQKWWCFVAMCLVLSRNLGSRASSKAPQLSS